MDPLICPGCGHTAGVHNKEVGCTHGWSYDIDGNVNTEGCACEWAHTTSQETWR